VLTSLEKEIFETHYRAATACDILQNLVSKANANSAVILDENNVEDLVTINSRVSGLRGDR
jgi:hypothetical protein